MTAVILMVCSAGIVFALGTIHLVFTFFGHKLHPRDHALQIRMAEVAPVITRETTMWKCWIGFNASHSMAAMLFGLIYAYLASVHGEILFQSTFLLAIGLSTLIGFAVLARLYWFRSPLFGVCASLLCFVASVVVFHR